MTKKIFLTGIVQGVGFRPCCKKVADSMRLDGTVKNLGSNAEIVIRAETRVTEEFLRRLISLLPKEAKIDTVLEEECDEFKGSGFTILESEPSSLYLPEIIPDIATCDGCIAELENKTDRRHLHPFISCTACGPRYSIIKALPYDRENTLMDKFPICERCKTEYKNPSDRRLHAQTVACKDCGPALNYYPASYGEPLDNAINAIKNGGVVAVKDIGGYHFVCLPNSRPAVDKLRLLKLRDKKPFAVMFGQIEGVEEYANINEIERQLLLSPARPIVLLEKTKDFDGAVCGDSAFLGAMLPSNPVQHLLCKALGPLVMTSGNISGEPIITENAVMLKMAAENEHLDGVLYHDRDIITSLDDSIYYVLDSKAHLSRRGRGVAPASINADCGDKTIFASGGDLKSCFGFYKNGKAVLSQHFGDLEDDGCAAVFEKSARHMSTLFGFSPDITVTDLHPLYFSSSLAEKLYNKKPLTVQHHHAHIASVMAEHGLDACLGFALDGTGYGDDGTVWGGEALALDGVSYKRVAHLKSVMMCGGDSVSKNAAEALACYLLDAGRDIPEWVMSKKDSEIVASAIKHRINSLNSSSCGRLFDAVCCLLGLGDYNHYEGQCAILLENSANSALKEGILAYRLDLDYNNGILETPKLICDILKAKENGADIKALALGFHYALADGFLKVAIEQNIKKIALSGGVFQNRVFTSVLTKRLTEAGFGVYMNEKVPCGDGGIALGQLFIAGRKD